jgi:hypothetical protein
MKMVGSGSAADRAVVIDRKVGVHFAEEQHVGEMMPDGLGQMLIAHNHQVVPEDGEWIYLDIIVSALFTLVFKMELFFMAILDAKETFARCNRVRINISGG